MRQLQVYFYLYMKIWFKAIYEIIFENKLFIEHSIIIRVLKLSEF